jgi:hypothetical protein
MHSLPCYAVPSPPCHAVLLFPSQDWPPSNSVYQHLLYMSYILPIHTLHCYCHHYCPPYPLLPLFIITITIALHCGCLLLLSAITVHHHTVACLFAQEQTLSSPPHTLMSPAFHTITAIHHHCPLLLSASTAIIYALLSSLSTIIVVIHPFSLNCPLSLSLPLSTVITDSPHHYCAHTLLLSLSPSLFIALITIYLHCHHHHCCSHYYCIQYDCHSICHLPLLCYALHALS